MERATGLEPVTGYGAGSWPLWPCGLRDSPGSAGLGEFLPPPPFRTSPTVPTTATVGRSHGFSVRPSVGLTKETLGGPPTPETGRDLPTDLEEQYKQLWQPEA